LACTAGGTAANGPDAKTVWLYREQLKQAAAIEGLFRRFDEALATKGYLAMGGQIIDATLIAARRQKLTIEEKATIREGGTPADPSKAKWVQKDRDARWTLKRGRAKSKAAGGAQRQAIQIARPVFGYKSHIGTDRRHGLIRRWTVTDAAGHDSRSFPVLLDTQNTASPVWARESQFGGVSGLGRSVMSAPSPGRWAPPRPSGRYAGDACGAPSQRQWQAA
jgi:IS5 family transposase